MTSIDRWKEISSFFNEALTRPPGERAAFLATACPDESLREQVAALLACEAPAEQFLDATAAQIGGGIADPGHALVGERLGAYRVDSLIGAGGMGTVYKATDTRLDRTVALKILPPALKDESAFLQRFEREARAIAALRHPHICVLHDIGREGDAHFLVMEYLEGETLASRLTRGPLTVEDTLRYANEIASALVEMHAHGIIHRDLKPANIMLTKTGAQLLDFGLARFAQAANDAAPGGVLATTGGHTTFDATSRAGTLSYMAPEQVRGEAVDHRADIFAFGAILYEAATGAKAFRGDSPQAVADAVLHDDPPSLPPTAPPGLDGVIRRCLEKVAAERWPDAGALAAALLALTPVPVARSGRRRTWLLLGLAAVALSLGALGWRTGRSSGNDVTPRGSGETPTLSLENVRLLTGEDLMELSPTLSPDGRSIAYSRGLVSRVQAVTRPLEGGAPAVLHQDVESQNQPRWSPDGTEILWVTLDGVRIAPAGGGTSRIVVARMPIDDPHSYVGVRTSVSAAAWAPEGRRIVVVDNSDKSVSIVSLEDGRRTHLATATVDLHSCDWSPDGRWIACTAGNWQGHFAGVGWSIGNFAASAIVVVPAAGGAIREITDYTAMNQSPVWSADSRRLYFVSNRARTFDIYSQAIAGDGAAAGAPARLTTGLGAWSLAFSADRKRLAYTVHVARANIWSLPIPDAGPVSVAAAAQPFTRGTQMIESMRVSRSGKWLVYDSNIAGTFDIYRAPVAGGPPERLTTEPGDEFLGDLAADDRSVVYHSWLTTSRDLFVKTIGGGAPVQITDFPGQEAQPVWSPDGRSIVFTDFTDDAGMFRGALVMTRDASGAWGAPRLFQRGAWRPSWSPDGTFLAVTLGLGYAVVSPRTGESRIFYTPRPNSEDPRGGDAIVSDDGRTVYVKSHNQLGQAFIWAFPLAGGAPRLLVEFGDRSSPRTDFAAGQGRFFFGIDERRSNIWLADVREQ